MATCSCRKAGKGVASLAEHKVQYGSGAKGLANKNGTSVEVAQEFIDNYYGRYKQVAQWQESVAKEVKASRVPTLARGKVTGEPLGKGFFHSITGRVYVFHEQESTFQYYSREQGRKVYRPPSFKPTEMKNYPVNLAA